MASEQIVWCANCIDHDNVEITHVFSTRDKLVAYLHTLQEGDYKLVIAYDYLVDHPERMDARFQ